MVKTKKINERSKVDEKISIIFSLEKIFIIKEKKKRYKIDN